MSEPENPAGPRAPIARPLPRRAAARTGNPLGWLLLFLLLAAAGYGLWYGWQWGAGAIEAVSTQQELLARLGREVQGLRAQADELGTRQTDLAQAVQRNGQQIASMDGRLQDADEAVARLSDTVEGGRVRVQLAAVEQLLLMANDRLLLAHDASSALRALDLADQRLARLSDPRLHAVREALATERTAVTRLVLPDTTGFALALGDIQKRAATLPLRTRVPGQAEAAPEVAPAEPGPSGFGRTTAAVRAALGSIFSLRRDERGAPRLLAPEEAALVGQILELKIEGARLALLAHDGLAFREMTGAAAAWLKRYYDVQDAEVQFALGELERLGAHSLAPALPDISRSLALLRSHLGTVVR